MVSFLRKQWNTMPKHRNGMDAKWEAKESKIYKRIEVTRRIGCSYARILFWEQRRRKSEGVGIGGLLRVSNTGVCVWGGGGSRVVVSREDWLRAGLVVGDAWWTVLWGSVVRVESAQSLH
jgi:hypothetical protein